MKIELIESKEDMFACNCWLIDIESNVIAVDIGIPSEDFLKQLGNRKLKAILLTHGHFDHIMGVEDVRSVTGADVFVAREDAEMVIDSKKSLAVMRGIKVPPVKMFFRAEGVLYIEGFEVEVIPTPGHTNGSVTYKIGNSLFTGDTLFKCCIGRTDLPGGDMEKLKMSLKTLKNLDGDYMVYPGHNDITTMQFERNNNPYLVKV